MVSSVETSQEKDAHKDVVSDVKKPHKDVVWMKNVHKGVVRGKRAKGVVRGKRAKGVVIRWEHGQNVPQTKGKAKSSCVVMDGVNFGWEHGMSVRRTKKNSIAFDVDSGLEETSILLPWNVAYNFKDEKTTTELIKTLSSMYEKPSATKLKSDDVRDFILSERTRRRESGESSGKAYAFKSRGRGRQQGRSASHHGRSKSTSRGPRRSNVNILCWRCGGDRHVKRSCPKIRKKEKGKSQGSDEDEEASANSVAEYDSDALCVSTECSVDAWVLDSESFVHSTPCKELFQRFKSEKLEHVHLTNG
uniref:CCHC-type domain-containing protein n=1 Tax=Chenopodium quinoa TaxID=63459 RepID=A0A803LAJ9_CHEQI